MSTSFSRRLNGGSTCAIVLAILVACILPVGTAHAQFPFWSQHRSGWSDYTPSRHKHHHRTKTERSKESQPEDAAKGPLQIIISIEDQRISLYDNGELIARSSVSTGVPSHPTPLGVFSVIGKQRWHRSNIYSAAPMPYMQRITWSGIALHAGVLPGYPASHGCIRLTDSFATRLFHLTKRGTRVIIARDDVRPFDISNPHLFVSKSTVSNSPGSQVATAATGGITTAAMDAPSISVSGAQEAASLQMPTTGGATLQKARPISVLVSRKLGRLLVRQDFTPLFDVPIKIENPEEPLGTHVFTANASQNERPAIHWTVVSMPEEFSRSPGAPQKSHKERMKQTIAPVVPPTEKANAALNRIEIPQDAFERISDLIMPGSSLIVSDRGVSEETGSDTDFIVEVR